MEFDLFSPKTPPVIGMDVSPSSVKMVELSGSVDKMRVERIAIELLPSGVIGEESIHDMEALTKAILDCHRKLGSRIKRIATSIPSHAIKVEIFSVDEDMNELEIEEHIINEMNGKMNFDIEEAAIDFTVMGIDEEGNQQIYAAATLKNRVDDLHKAIELAGLTPAIIDSEQLSITDCAQKFLERQGIEHKDKVIFMIDIGNNSTKFIFTINEEIIHSRESMSGGEQLTEQLINRFGVSREDALKIKAGVIRAEDETIATEMRNSFSMGVADEARREMSVFLSSSNYSNINHVLLAGGGASLAGTPDAISEVLNTEVTVFNPFNGMDISNNIDKQKLMRDSSALVVACGNAMRRFDK